MPGSSNDGNAVAYTDGVDAGIPWRQFFASRSTLDLLDGTGASRLQAEREQERWPSFQVGRDALRPVVNTNSPIAGSQLRKMKTSEPYGHYCIRTLG